MKALLLFILIGFSVLGQTIVHDPNDYRYKMYCDSLDCYNLSNFQIRYYKKIDNPLGICHPLECDFIFHLYDNTNPEINPNIKYNQILWKRRGSDWVMLRMRLYSKPKNVVIYSEVNNYKPPKIQNNFIYMPTGNRISKETFTKQFTKKVANNYFK